MKKSLAIALAVLLAFSFAACGGGAPAAPSPAATPSSDPAPAATPSTDPAPAATPSSNPAPAATPSTDPAPAATPSPDPASAATPTPEPAPEPTPAPSGVSGQVPSSVDLVMDSLIGWMKTGTFRFDFTMTTEMDGGWIEMSGVLAVDGDDMSFSMETEEDGITVRARVLMKDGAIYVIDDENKFMMKMPGVSTELTGGMVTDYTGMEMTGSGTGRFNGRELPYEDYEADGAPVRFYLDGDQVCGIELENDGMKSTMVVSKPTNKIPPGTFDLPEGYMTF